jgi:hypothetical protein
MGFVRLVKLCMQFDISAEDVQEIRAGFARWVQQFEE